jgi:hypothetical protein
MTDYICTNLIKDDAAGKAARARNDFGVTPHSLRKATAFEVAPVFQSCGASAGIWLCSAIDQTTGLAIALGSGREAWSAIAVALKAAFETGPSIRADSCGLLTRFGETARVPPNNLVIGFRAPAPAVLLKALDERGIWTTFRDCPRAEPFMAALRSPFIDQTELCPITMAPIARDRVDLVNYFIKAFPKRIFGADADFLINDSVTKRSILLKHDDPRGRRRRPNQGWSDPRLGKAGELNEEIQEVLSFVDPAPRQL